jgi:hypothetical protein
MEHKVGKWGKSSRSFAMARKGESREAEPVSAENRCATCDREQLVALEN